MPINNYLTNMMINFASKTQNHINLVRYNLFKLSCYNNQIELKERSNNHDLSKYTKNEYNGYMYLIEKHNEYSTFIFTEEHEEIIKKAIQHHYQVNRHHPEHFDDINDMNKIDLIEMVVNWAARSEELGNSLIGWYNSVNQVKYQFNSEQQKIIENVIKMFPELK